MGEDVGTDGEIWRAACEEALTALRYAQIWELPGRSWAAVGALVGDMARAVAAADLDLLSHSTGSLELCGPLRVGTRAGDDDSDKRPAPMPVKEQIAAVVNELTRAAEDAKRSR